MALIILGGAAAYLLVISRLLILLSRHGVRARDRQAGV